MNYTKTISSIYILDFVIIFFYFQSNKFIFNMSSEAEQMSLIVDENTKPLNQNKLNSVDIN